MGWGVSSDTRRIIQASWIVRAPLTSRACCLYFYPNGSITAKPHRENYGCLPLFFSPCLDNGRYFVFLLSIASFFFFPPFWWWGVRGAEGGREPGQRDAGDPGQGTGHWHAVALPPSHRLVLSPSALHHLTPLAPLVTVSPTLLPSSSPLSLSSPPPPSSPSPCSLPHRPLPVPLKATIIAACLALHLVSMRKFPPLPLFAFVISKPCNSSFAQGCGKCPFFNTFLWLMFVIL